MKVNVEFITNSSCASFIIPRKYLSQYQIEQIINHIEESNKYVDAHRGPQNQIFNHPEDAWNIDVTNEAVIGDTIMDNFDMMWFLLKIGVDEEHIEHHGCYE